jgi:hypothetical protein
VQEGDRVVVIFTAALAANGRFNKIFQYLPFREPCDILYGLIKKSSTRSKKGVCTGRMLQID